MKKYNKFDKYALVILFLLFFALLPIIRLASINDFEIQFAQARFMFSEIFIFSAGIVGMLFGFILSKKWR